MKPRKETNINNAFTVDSIITVYYLDWEKSRSKEIGKNAVSYNFWQLLYVDRGEYTCSIDGHIYTISSGGMILCEPQKVRISLSHKNAMVAIISFRCNSECIHSIKNSLELLLINLYKSDEKHSSLSAQNHINYYEQKFRAIESYMLENLSENISLDEISVVTGFSKYYKTHIQQSGRLRCSPPLSEAENKGSKATYKRSRYVHDGNIGKPRIFKCALFFKNIQKNRRKITQQLCKINSKMKKELLQNDFLNRVDYIPFF